MCNVNNEALKCVDILVFKGSTAWLFNRTIFPNRVSKDFFLCSCSIDEYVKNYSMC